MHDDCEGRGDRERPNDSITPVLISWLKHATPTGGDDAVRLDGLLMDKFKICGRVISHHSKSTKTFVKIEDGTEMIELSCNKKFDEEVPKVLRDINIDRRNSFIKAIVEVGSFDGKVFYTAIKFNQIPNHNYLTFHYLDCLYSQKIRREGYQTGIPSHKSTSGANGGADAHSPNAEKDTTQTVLDKLRFLSGPDRKPVTLAQILSEFAHEMQRTDVNAALLSLTEDNLIRTAPGSEGAYELVK